MPLKNYSSYDITVVQQGDTYTVSGNDAQALHAALTVLPENEQTLIVGELVDGKFTLRKSAAELPKRKATGG